MNKRLLIVAAVGVVATAGALWYRQRAISSAEFRLAQLMKNPHARQLDAHVSQLQRKVADAPNDKAARVELAETYGKLRLMDLAAEQLEAVVKLDPNDEAAAVGLGNALMAMQNFPKAEAQFRAVTAKWPKDAYAWQGLATIMHQRSHFLEAIECSREAVKLDPSDPNSEFILASSLVGFARQYPSPETYKPFFKEARKILHDLLPVWPSPGEIHLRLASCEAGLSDGKAAIAEYQKAAELLDNRPDVLSELIKELVGAGRNVEAKKVVDLAIARYPNHGPFHDMQGQILEKSTAPGDGPAALKSFQMAARYSPQNPYVLDHLGSALMRAGRLEEAKKAFESSVQANPERPLPYQQLSVVYTRLKDRARANDAANTATRMVHNDQQLRQIELLTATYPTDVKLQIVLADRYVDLDMLGPARDKYLMILKLDRNNESAKAGLQKIDKLEKEKAERLAKS